MDKVVGCFVSLSTDNNSSADTLRLSVLEPECDARTVDVKQMQRRKVMPVRGVITLTQMLKPSAGSSYSREDFEADLNVSNNEDEREHISFMFVLSRTKFEMQSTLI